MIHCDVREVSQIVKLEDSEESVYSVWVGADGHYGNFGPLAGTGTFTAVTLNCAAGSDHAPFQQHLGIPVMDIRFVDTNAFPGKSVIIFSV